MFVRVTNSGETITQQLPLVNDVAIEPAILVEIRQVHSLYIFVGLRNFAIVGLVEGRPVSFFLEGEIQGSIYKGQYRNILI
mgnify:CR=1 FL=1